MAIDYGFSSARAKFFNNKLLSDSFWSLLGNVVSKGLGLVSGIFIARFLGSNIYGEYGIIRNTLMSSAIFATFGLGYTATKYIAEYKATNPNLVHLILKYCNIITFLASGILAVLLFLFAQYFATYVLEAPHLKNSLRLASLYVIFNASNTTQIGVISGFGGFKVMSKVNSIVGVFVFFSTIILSYFFGLNGALIALVLSQVLNWYLNNVIIKRLSKDFLGDDVKDISILKDILTFSLPVALQEGIFAISSFGINYLIIIFSDYKEMGIYSAAIQWFVMILFIPGILRNVILSHLSEVNNDRKKYYKILNTILGFNLIITLIPFFIIFFMSGYISSFYGVSFKGIEDIINIVVFTAVFASLSNVYNQAYLSASKNWFIFVSRIIRDFGIIITCYLLFKFKIDMRGALIIAWCNLIFNIIYFILISMYFIVKVKKID